MVPVSRDLLGAAALGGGVVGLVACWPAPLQQLRALMRDWILLAPGAEVQPWPALQSALLALVQVVSPVLAGAFGAALVVGLVHTGGMISLSLLSPDPGRLKPSRHGGRSGEPFRASAALLKFLLLSLAGGAIFMLIWRTQVPGLLALVEHPAPETLIQAFLLALAAIIPGVALVVALVVALDLVFTRVAYYRRMGMTRREVRQEKRESGGDPRRRAEQRRAHQEILLLSSIAAVAEADCVVACAGRAAAAMQYRRKTDRAPRVLVSGRREIAQRILEKAWQHGIPVVEDHGLARSLAALQPNQEVPASLYEALADIYHAVVGDAAEN